MMETNLWAEVGEECLTKAADLLKKGTTPTAATVEVVKGLVEIAISIDDLNLRWAKNQYDRKVCVVRPFNFTEEDNGDGSL